MRFVCNNFFFISFFLYTLSVSTLVAFAILLSFANGAPPMRRYRRQYESMQDDPFGYPHKIPWKNSCGIRNDTMLGFVNSLRNRTVSVECEFIELRATEWFEIVRCFHLSLSVVLIKKKLIGFGYVQV